MCVRLLFILSLSALLCAAARGAGRDEQPRPGPGVSRELARWRAAHYRDVHYLLSVRLERGAGLMRGELKIGVVLDSAAGDLVLDWRVVDKNVDPASRVSGIQVNGRSVRDARFEDEHIRIPRRHLVAGENKIAMDFASPVSTSGSAVTRYLDREDNSEYVYTLFVPSDASTAFPCFDQPDLKARFKLRVMAPESWTVVSNAEGRVQPEFDDTGGGRPQSPPAGTRWHWFGETEPISTYQFAFAAGPFAEFKDEGSPYKTRLFVRRSKAERAKREVGEVFRLNRGALKFFEDYFAHRFPFSKYDLVLLPEFAYGGMEHAGATFLREESVLFPSDPTAGDLLSRADVMLHEAAHQWFGDLVTMRWFDDLWLKEGFATFMAYKAVAALMPEYDAWKVFHLRNKPLAYLTDVTRGTTPIFQEIANLSAAKSAYGNIVYRKAPSMLRQAEFYLGEREFRDAVRLVVKEHAYANATWDDLVGAFERTSKRRLGAWADAWVRRRGMPDVRAGWDYSPRDRSVKLTLTQRDVLGERGVWPMRVKVIFGYEGATPAHAAPVLLSGTAAATRVASPGGRPAFVFANFEDHGYGRFLLDEKSRAYVARNLGAVRDAFLRALLWGSLWDSVREAEMAPADFVELAVREAARERDDVALQFLLSRAQTAFTRYLSDEQQRGLAPRFEAMLRERMLNAETAGLRITYFRTFRDAATTAEALTTLRDILTGKLRVPGMTLRTRDRFDLIRALLAAGDEAAAAALERQGAEDRSDDARRYAYAAAASAPDAGVKKKYFGQYLSDKDLPESWIEASLSSFNTPRQSALTFPYLAPALRELPSLKRTRKIFFVNGWLAAFIGGQCDERALGAVSGFLESEKTLDEDLRRKVLEAADGLERCVRIRRRYAPAAP